MRLPLVLAALLAILPHAVQAAPVRDAKMVALATRLFPTLAAVQTTPGAIDKVREDRGAAVALAERRRRAEACGRDAACLVRRGLWTPAEQEALARAIGTGAAGATARLRSPDDNTRAGVLRELQGLNGILKVYGQAEQPRYPLIDGPVDAPGSKTFDQRLAAAAALAQVGNDDPVTALDPSIGLALALLDVNDRDGAIAFDPLEVRENAQAAARARQLDWSRYRFTAIILTGVGPDDLATPLSPLGKLNVRMAARRFGDGVAPFIIVSGSAVHPRGTPYVEAIEMRRALIERYGVPADAIVLEPYARHTTTNLRNAVRRLMALGAPLDRDALILTNPVQSAAIESPGFAERNARELGYQPGKVGRRLSPNELAFRPDPVSARVDPADPVDP